MHFPAQPETVHSAAFINSTRVVQSHGSVVRKIKCQNKVGLRRLCGAATQEKARVSYKDVRDWIQQVSAMGELKVIEGADWNLEIGALSVLASKHRENSPALLFDRIKDYPAGYRILVGFFESLRRSALTLNLPLDITREGFIQACRERLATRPVIPPATVATGPVRSEEHTSELQ